MPTGAERIAAERQRQIDEEGWTPEHDAEHTEGELVRAARFYLHAGRLAEQAPEVLASVRGYIERRGENPDDDRDVQRIAENYPRHYYGWNEVPREWPWHSSWWKPSADPIRNLEKAGALIAAEIDRLERREVRSEEEEGGKPMSLDEVREVMARAWTGTPYGRGNRLSVDSILEALTETGYAVVKVPEGSAAIEHGTSLVVWNPASVPSGYLYEARHDR